VLRHKNGVEIAYLNIKFYNKRTRKEVRLFKRVVGDELKAWYREMFKNNIKAISGFIKRLRKYVVGCKLLTLNHKEDMLFVLDIIKAGKFKI
jgi:hypothetical protein